MIKFHLRAGVAISLVCVLLVPNQLALAHTGYAPIPIFTFTTHPDFPMEDFVAGRLGILLQSYNPRFLFAAYRNLTGAKFTSAEALAMKRSWEPLLNNRYKSSIAYDRFETNWREKWFRMRLQPGKDPAARTQFERQIYAESYLHKDGHYVFFENCADDAFRKALLTLRRRERAFGKHSPRVQAWLTAQDEVFENCSDAGRASGTHIPVAVADREPALVRQDRAYQIAAAHFYRGDFEDAVSRFSVIAQDPISPWRGIAPYLTGRALLRQAQFDAPKGRQFDATALDAAAAALRSVIADKSRREWHEPAANLLAFIEIRLDPPAACSQLAARIARRGSISGSAQSLTDYLYLVNESREFDASQQSMFAAR